MDPGELRRIEILADLPDERLEELARHGQERWYDAGDYVFHTRDEAIHWWLLLEGELETTLDVAGDAVPLLHHSAGGFLGAISILTGEPLRGSTRASVGSRRRCSRTASDCDGETFRRGCRRLRRARRRR